MQTLIMMGVIYHSLQEFIGNYFCYWIYLLAQTYNFTNLFLRGRDFDVRQWESIYIYNKYNVPCSYRDTSELNRSIQAEKRASDF